MLEAEQRSLKALWPTLPAALTGILFLPFLLQSAKKKPQNTGFIYLCFPRHFFRISARRSTARSFPDRVRRRIRFTRRCWTTSKDLSKESAKSRLRCHPSQTSPKSVWISTIKKTAHVQRDPTVLFNSLFVSYY